MTARVYQILNHDLIGNDGSYREVPEEEFMGLKEHQKAMARVKISKKIMDDFQMLLRRSEGTEVAEMLILNLKSFVAVHKRMRGDKS